MKNLKLKKMLDEFTFNNSLNLKINPLRLKQSDICNIKNPQIKKLVALIIPNYDDFTFSLDDTTRVVKIINDAAYTPNTTSELTTLVSNYLLMTKYFSTPDENVECIRASNSLVNLAAMMLCINLVRKDGKKVEISDIIDGSDLLLRGEVDYDL